MVKMVAVAIVVAKEIFIVLPLAVPPVRIFLTFFANLENGIMELSALGPYK